MIHPEAHAPVRDIPDYEGDRETVYRSLDTLVIPAITIGLDGIRELRKALDEGEAGILAYRFRTVDRGGIDMFRVRYQLAFLGFGEVADIGSVDWLAVGRKLAGSRGGLAELRKLHALLAGTGAPEIVDDEPGLPPAEMLDRFEPWKDGDGDEGGPMFGEAELRRADAYRLGIGEDCGCGLGAARCRAAEDGDFGDY